MDPSRVVLPPGTDALEKGPALLLVPHAFEERATLRSAGHMVAGGRGDVAGGRGRRTEGAEGEVVGCGGLYHHFVHHERALLASTASLVTERELVALWHCNHLLLLELTWALHDDILGHRFLLSSSVWLLLHLMPAAPGL